MKTGIRILMAAAVVTALVAIACNVRKKPVTSKNKKRLKIKEHKGGDIPDTWEEDGPLLACKCGEYYFLVECTISHYDDERDITYFFNVLTFNYGKARYESIIEGEIDSYEETKELAEEIHGIMDIVIKDNFSRFTDSTIPDKNWLDAETLAEIVAEDEYEEFLEKLV